MILDQEDRTATVIHAFETTPMPAVPQQKLSRARRIFSVIVGILVGLLCLALPVGLYQLDGPPEAVIQNKLEPNWTDGVPIGITLSGLQQFVMQPSVITTLEKQTWAAKNYWHANTIRYQILQDRLVGSKGNRYAPYYMHYITKVTNYALSLGMHVVLNAQTELSIGYSKSEPLPDYATTVFWDKILRHYKNNPRVILDLFNEPRYCDWDQWKAAHQQLINHIRGEGAKNTIWVEGRWWGSTLEGVPLLHDKLRKLAYTFHHPGAPWPDQAPVSKETWDKAFGYLTDKGVRVVDGEFANFTGSYDWQDPYIPGYFKPGLLVSKYLRYLRSHHIGMLAWSLLPGSLNRTADYKTVSVEPQGDGLLVRNWFRRIHRANLGLPA